MESSFFEGVFIQNRPFVNPTVGYAFIEEGVETEEQLRTLQQLGCDMVRDILLSRALDYEYGDTTLTYCCSGRP